MRTKPAVVAVLVALTLAAILGLLAQAPGVAIARPTVRPLTAGDRAGRIGLDTGSVPAPLPGTLVLQDAGRAGDEMWPGYRGASWEVTATWGPGPSTSWSLGPGIPYYDDRVRIKDLGGLYRPQWIRNGAWYADGIGAYAPNADTTLTVGAKLYRYYGSTRYWTNWEVGGEFFPGVVTFATADEAMFTAGSEDLGAPLVVATGEDFPDALSAGALAAAVGGRLIITRHDALPPDILYGEPMTPDGPAGSGLEYFVLSDGHVPVSIERRKVYIVGGVGAVGQGVEDWFLRRNGETFWSPTVVRLAGPDRYATAAAVAEEIVSATGTTTVNPVVVSGENFPDAIGGSALASARRQPLLLVRQDSVPASTAAFCQSRAATDSIVLGGSAVVSDAVAEQVRAATRIAGEDRYETCAQAVTFGLGKGWFKPYHMAVTTGVGFADGLSAGSALGRLGWPTLLTRPAALPPSSAEVLQGNTVLRASLLGGPRVVSAGVAASVKSLLK